MLSVLRKVFVPEASQSDLIVTEENNPSFITDRQKINKLLQQIIESPPLCTVTFRNSNKPFFTSILEVQSERNRVVFDELTPESGNKLINQSTSVKLFTYVNGVHVTFQLDEINREQSHNRIIYTARIPATVYYPQRRTSPRVQVESSAIDFQGTSKDSGLVLKGSVLDISRTGLCVAFANSGGSIQSGDKLTNCLIHLPDENTFAFDLSVRSIRKSAQHERQKQIGGYFNALSPQHQSKLDRYFCALERQYIRKRKN